MAKMTAEDKFANKAAQKIRDNAYLTRRKAYRDARDRVEKRIEASPEAQVVVSARDAMEAAIEARNEAQRAIAAQIAALQERLIAVGKEGEAPINAAKQARDVAWSAKDKLAKAQLALVDADFADVANVQYVGAWEIPAPVKQQMDAASEAARQQLMDAADD